VKRARLLTIVFSIKVVLFLVWFALSFNTADMGTVHAESSVADGLVVTDGIKIVDVEGEEAGKEEEGEIDVSTETLITDTERSMLEAIRRRESELNDKEEDLKKYEQRLAVVKEELDQRMKELKDTKVVVDKALTTLKSAEKMRTQRVVKIYESMAPEEAAVRIEKLDEKTAVMILSMMKEKKAGVVLGLVAVDKAVKYSQMMNKPLMEKRNRR